MRYKTMKNKLSILIVLPNILWFIQVNSFGILDMRSGN